jgi:hypothetical protein
VTAPGGSRLIVDAAAPLGIDAAVSADGTSSEPLVRSLEPRPAAPVALTLPDLDAAWPWTIELTPGSAGGYRICVSAG